MRRVQDPQPDSRLQAAPPRGGSGAAAGLGAPSRIWSSIKGPGFIFSSRRLWLLSVALHRGGHRRLAKAVKNINSMLYHNSLPPAVQVSPDIQLGHHGFGTILHNRVVIGREVKIYQNVTMAVRPQHADNRIVIEDEVLIGAGAVIMTPRKRSITIGRGARVGAGAVVTHDVPPHTLALAPQPEMRPRLDGRDPEDLGLDD